MRKKYLSKTYLRDIDSYELKIYIDAEKDYNLVVKKMIKVQKPFIAANGDRLIDNGTYIVEVNPKNENYNMRAYFSENGEVLEYYFDVSRENGIDEDIKIPYYDDLFTDVIVSRGELRVVDENELLEAYHSGMISNEDVELANRVRDQLVTEIESGTNRFMNMDFSSYLN